MVECIHSSYVPATFTPPELHQNPERLPGHNTYGDNQYWLTGTGSHKDLIFTSSSKATWETGSEKSKGVQALVPPRIVWCRVHQTTRSTQVPNHSRKHT